MLSYLHWVIIHYRRLRKFKDIHNGEGCFIIGNGPSINSMDLSMLRDYHTFGLNKIYLIFDKVDLNLSYHVSVNSLVIQQSVSQFEALPCPSFLSFRAAHNVIRHLDHIFFIITGGPHTFRSNLLREIHEGYTVTYVAIQIAFYMGFSKVFLIGIDHNYTFAGNPNEIQTFKGTDINHFDLGYFNNEKWQLPDLEGSELSYHLAKFHFRKSERLIYDATFNGNLQIFPKVAFRDALNICNKCKKT